MKPTLHTGPGPSILNDFDLWWSDAYRRHFTRQDPLECQLETAFAQRLKAIKDDRPINVDYFKTALRPPVAVVRVAW